MPICECRCRECGKVTEALVPMSGNADVACFNCGGKKPERRFSTFATRGSSSSGNTSDSCPTGTCPLS